MYRSLKSESFAERGQGISDGSSKKLPMAYLMLRSRMVLLKRRCESRRHRDVPRRELKRNRGSKTGEEKLHICAGRGTPSVKGKGKPAWHAIGHREQRERGARHQGTSRGIKGELDGTYL